MEHEKIESERVIFRLVYILKRQTDKWATDKLAALEHSGFTMTFMPYFMNIGRNGISNIDLVNRIKVTKQGVSKTVKELEKLDLVYTVKNDNDARSIMIYLTEKGVKFYETTTLTTEGLTEDYRKLLGQKNYENMVDSLIKLIDYNEGL